MGRPEQHDIKRTHSLFVDNLKVYQQDHQKLQVANEIIVKVSMDTGVSYWVKKSLEVVYNAGTIIKGEKLAVPEKKDESTRSRTKQSMKFLGCEQPGKTEVKKMMTRAKKEMQNRTEQLVRIDLHDSNLMKAIN